MSCENSDSENLIATTQFDQTLSPCVRVWLARLGKGYIADSQTIKNCEILPLGDNLDIQEREKREGGGT